MHGPAYAYRDAKLTDSSAHLFTVLYRICYGSAIYVRCTTAFAVRASLLGAGIQHVLGEHATEPNVLRSATEEGGHDNYETKIKTIEIERGRWLKREKKCSFLNSLCFLFPVPATGRGMNAKNNSGANIHVMSALR